jgi:putative Mn2+ efflux pump MntP
MTEVLLLGLLVGLDNLQVGAALGLLPISTGRRWAFAGMFVLCETAMPLLGLLLGHAARMRIAVWADELGIAVLGLSGVLTVVLALCVRRGEHARQGNWLERDAAIAGLPLSLSLDNLAVGVGLGSLGFPVVLSALLIGGVSGALGALGLFSGTQLRRWAPERSELWGGMYLMALAAVRLLEKR